MSSATSGASARSPRRAPKPLRVVARRVHGAVTGLRDVARAAVAGDRPLVVVLAVALVLSTILLSGPMQNYLAARDRVAVLAAQDAALTDDLARLRQQEVDLNDPEQLELRARRDGYVRPGEVAWFVVPPAVERPQIVPAPDAADPGEDPWWVRVWRNVTGVLGN